MTYTLHHGDCLDVMPAMQEASIDAMITDPPAGIGFMGKEWDDFRRARNEADAGRDNVFGRTSQRGPEYGRRDRDAFIAFMAKRLAEASRLLKPGGMALVWAIPRTAHWTGMAIEDAGLIVVDKVYHLFGTGFPKHQSKLKPACEEWILCRKKGPIQLLNIDACRIPVASADDKREFDYNHNGCNRSTVPDGGKLGMFDGGWKVRKGNVLVPAGRYPANVTHDGSDVVTSLFPAADSPWIGNENAGAKGGRMFGGAEQSIEEKPEYRDTGSAARFFYCSKVTGSDRDEGLDELNSKMFGMSGAAAAAAARGENYDNGDGGVNRTTLRKNHHPTVKNTELMRWLCRLITPPGGTVLDPFAGSGSTGKAAILEGFTPILIEREAEYIPIIEARCRHASMIAEAMNGMTLEEAREAYSKQQEETPQQSLSLMEPSA